MKLNQAQTRAIIDVLSTSKIGDSLTFQGALMTTLLPALGMPCTATVEKIEGKTYQLILRYLNIFVAKATVQVVGDTLKASIL